MLFAIALGATAHGFIPLIVDVTAAHANPFLFNSVISGSQAVMLFLFLRGGSRSAFGTSWSCREILRPGNAWLFWCRTGPSHSPRAPRKVREWIRVPALWGVAGNLTFALFTMATHYVDNAVAVVVFQLWVILSVLLLGRLGRLLAVGTQRPHQIAPRQSVLVVVAKPGFLIVGACAPMVGCGESETQATRWGWERWRS